jgi:site-specific DNA-methyltransferase (adenine-specific)
MPNCSKCDCKAKYIVYGTLFCGRHCKKEDKTPKNETNGSILTPIETPKTTNEEIPTLPSRCSSRERIIQGDFLEVVKDFPDQTFQIIIADPPYNIGKDFGNESDRQSEDKYLEWCELWINQCLRVLKRNGTLFIYGFSETLALILAKIPREVNRRWIIWHYTNKTVPNLNFWQRTHESILVLWKDDKIFNRDDVREEYTEEFLNGAAGKSRPATIGRFSKGDKTTTYTAHPQGALPRDVIKVPTLAGGNGKERAFILDENGEKIFHPTQKPLALCEKLILSCLQRSDTIDTGGEDDDRGTSSPIDPILIPFAGSGSECVTASKLGIPFVGIEINPIYVQIINKRLYEEKQ